MMNLFYMVASAIATAEGYWTLNSLPSKNRNPGDLREAPWIDLGAKRPKNKGFVVFESDAEGIAGLYHQIALDTARGKTLRQLIEKWAPPGDGNNTENYINETVRRTGLNPDIPLMQYLEIDRIP